MARMTVCIAATATLLVGPALAFAGGGDGHHGRHGFHRDSGFRLRLHIGGGQSRHHGWRYRHYGRFKHGLDRHRFHHRSLRHRLHGRHYRRFRLRRNCAPFGSTYLGRPHHRYRYERHTYRYYDDGGYSFETHRRAHKPNTVRIVRPDRDRRADRQRPVRRYDNQVYSTRGDRDRPVAQRGNDADGWKLLADGRGSAARTAFANEAERRPRDGTPKLGYALASAAIGDDEGAVWSMRRALHADPEALTQLRVDAGMGKRIEKLSEHYRNKAGYATQRGDASLMLASLSVIRGDEAEARRALAQARQHGVDRQAVRALERLIDKQAGQDGNQ